MFHLVIKFHSAPKKSSPPQQPDQQEISPKSSKSKNVSPTIISDENSQQEQQPESSQSRSVDPTTQDDDHQSTTSSPDGKKRRRLCTSKKNASKPEAQIIKAKQAAYATKLKELELQTQQVQRLDK